MYFCKTLTKPDLRLLVGQIKTYFTLDTNSACQIVVFLKNSSKTNPTALIINNVSRFSVRLCYSVMLHKIDPTPSLMEGVKDFLPCLSIRKWVYPYLAKVPPLKLDYQRVSLWSDYHYLLALPSGPPWDSKSSCIYNEA